MKLRISIFLLCCLSVFFGLTLSAHAKIKLSPSVTFEEEYTDNLFLDHNNEEDEWITTIEPGVAIKVDSKWIDLTLDYSFRFSHYMKHDDLTDVDFQGGQRANLGTTFFEGRPFTLGVNGTITRETIDESENSSDANELVNKSTVYVLTVNPQYRFRLGGNSSLVLGYIYDRTDHEDSRGDNSQGHSGKVSLIKALSTNTDISANYTYRINQSEDEDEYHKQSFTLGFDQQLGPRTTISLEGGFNTVTYENDLGREEGTTWQVDISYRLTAPITLSLMFSQDFDNSSTDGLTESRDANFMIDYTRDSFNASAEVYWDQSDYLRVDREDQSYGSRFGLSFPLYSNLSAGFNADYEKAEYKDVIDKKVDQYSLGTSFNYEFSRFVSTLSYRYRVNDSDINTDDYTENTVTLSVTARF